MGNDFKTVGANPCVRPSIGMHINIKFHANLMGEHTGSPLRN